MESVYATWKQIDELSHCFVIIYVENFMYGQTFRHENMPSCLNSKYVNYFKIC